MGKGKFAPVEKKSDRNGQAGQKDGSGHSGSSDSEQYVPPPDGGWGWVVVLSSFIIHVIADGVVYSFGVFLMRFVDYFKAGRAAVSWIGALQPAVTYTMGPVSSALTSRYGCRNVTMTGAVIAAVGFIISMWAPNLYYLYFSAGILAGIGFGLIYLPAIVCVAQYFEKRRSFATGLAVCGSGFGTFLLAPFTEFLVHEFTWRGAVLILGGIILNVVVCGIIFRPLEPAPAIKAVTSTEETAALLDKAGGVEVQTGNIQITVSQVTQDPQSLGDRLEKITAAETAEIVNSLQQLHLIPNGDTLTISGVVPVSYDHLAKDATSSQLPEGVDNIHGSNTGNSPISASQYLAKTDTGLQVSSWAMSDSALHKNSNEALDTSTTPRRRVHRASESSHGSTAALSPLHRKDIFYSGSLQNIPLYRSQPDLYLETVMAAHPHQDGATSEHITKKAGFFQFSEEFRETMKDMFDISLLRNPVFLMFALSNFFTSIGFNMPFIFLPDRAKVAGISEDNASLLLSVIGIANTAGRVIFGFLSDRAWVNRLMLYNTALTICGVATALSPVTGGNYPLMLTYAAVFGVFIGVYVSLTSVVLVDLLGLEYLTNSFGLLLFFQGAATFIGPPIAGLLYDWTGSYDISFIVMGIVIAVSGAMLFFLPCVQRYCEQHTPKESLVHDVELGKHPVAVEAVDLISIELLPPKV